MQVQTRGDQGRKAGGDSEVAAEVGVDAVSECLHTISGEQIERGESFGDSEEVGVAGDLATRVDGGRGEEEDAVSQGQKRYPNRRHCESSVGQ